MATSKPRITITLPPEQHALLQRLAGLQGGSMSAVLVDMLESVRPALERVCAAMEQAKAMHDGMREQLRQAAEESERAMQPHVAAALGQLDWLVEQIGTVGAQPERLPSPLTAASDSGPQSAETATATERQDPRPVITGVRSRGRKRKGGSAHEV